MHYYFKPWKALKDINKTKKFIIPKLFIEDL